METFPGVDPNNPQSILGVGGGSLPDFGRIAGGGASGNTSADGSSQQSSPGAAGSVWQAGSTPVFVPNSRSDGLSSVLSAAQRVGDDLRVQIVLGLDLRQFNDDLGKLVRQVAESVVGSHQLRISMQEKANCWGSR